MCFWLLTNTKRIQMFWSCSAKKLSYKKLSSQKLRCVQNQVKRMSFVLRKKHFQEKGLSLKHIQESDLRKKPNSFRSSGKIPSEPNNTRSNKSLEIFLFLIEKVYVHVPNILSRKLSYEKFSSQKLRCVRNQVKKKMSFVSIQGKNIFKKKKASHWSTSKRPTWEKNETHSDHQVNFLISLISPGLMSHLKLLLLIENVSVHVPNILSPNLCLMKSCHRSWDACKTK